MKPKPPCPTCGDVSKVKTQGGGTKNLYRYTCEKADCDTEWQQIPPHKVQPGEVQKVIMKSDAKRAVQYKCGFCGAKKKGHKCKKFQNAEDDGLATLSLVAIGDAEPSDEQQNADTNEMPPMALFNYPAPFSGIQMSVSSMSHLQISPFG